MDLVLSVVIGLLLCLFVFIIIIFIIVKKIFGNQVSGGISTIYIIFFIGGIQLFVMGIIGQYLFKTYLETKKCLIYIIKETEQDEE